MPLIKIGFKILSLLVLSSLLPPCSAMAKPLKRTALLIGNSIYQKDPLLSPSDDVSKMAKALLKSQFRITKKLNVKQSEMPTVISDFAEALKASGGIGVFYYAGYAVQVDGENYLIPVDAVIESEKAVSGIGFNLKEIIETMQGAGTRFNIVILETCHENPLGKDIVVSSTGLSQIVPPDDFLVMTACQPGKTLSAKDDRSSRFTDALAVNLAVPELVINDIVEKTIETVSESTKKKQIPWIASSLKREVSLNYPKRDFFYLLYDLLSYRSEWQYKTNLKDLHHSWKALEAFYPRWFSTINSGDTNDVIIYAMNDDLKGAFYEMLPVFEIDLSHVNSLGMKFIYIPPGKFTMGSQFDEPGRGKDENPHTVTLTQGFFIQSTEVTQGQWEALIGSNPSSFDDCGLDCPVENVSWDDALEFINRLNMLEDTRSYRLPTEAEWEYSARAGSKTWFSFGNETQDFANHAWYQENSGGSPHPVGQKEPNPWGIHDVHGNVWEWCQNWAGTYPKGSVSNPKGPSSGEYRVARGGSWFYGMLQARSANRFYLFPNDNNYTVGFRLVERVEF